MVLFQCFESEGLAHYSYLIGDGDRAVVIDPRRDCEAYAQMAWRAGMAITHVLETHRNEDYVSGSRELAALTGATVLHSSYDDLPYAYGNRLAEGQDLNVGHLRLQPLHTPGHTPGHLSFVLHDASGAPCVLFSGDALFAGDVGRCDFYGREKLAEMAGLLHESIFRRMLPLGDGVILCPAHGSGSACGTAIAERPWTSIGLERRLNPMLQFADKDEFVRHAARVLEYPPYFREMERLNLSGATGALPAPIPLTAAEFASRAEGAQVLDTRSELAFATGHVPGALSIWQAGIPGWAGWFLTYDRPILLVGEGNDPSPIVRLLNRMGYDRVEGFLAGGMISWYKAGLASAGYGTADSRALCALLAEGHELRLLDVRKDAELAEKAIAGALHIPLSNLPERLDEVPRHGRVHIICGSGVRSTTAASLLQRAGWNELTVVLGGMAGLESVGCLPRSGQRPARSASGGNA